MKKTVLILGSSEGIAYAEKMQNLLISRFRNMNMDYDCVLWSDPMVWENGEVTLTSLIHRAQKLKKETGFAITLFTPDDIVELRSETQYCSRDNVWLEYGLFVGIMDRSRVFAVCPSEPVEKSGAKKVWRKPSDFQQYEMKYEYRDSIKDAEPSLSGLAVQIADRINLKFPKNPSSDSDGEKTDSSPVFRRSY